MTRCVAPISETSGGTVLQSDGDVNGKTFPIQRGVKQGDVISPFLFNAGLEHAMRKWKLRLQHCGFDLGNGEILDDQLRVFSEHVFHSSWTTAAGHGAQWLSHEQAFMQFC